MGEDNIDDPYCGSCERAQPNKAELYEKLRKLNPREFAELHERNLRGEGSFDDLVSRLP